MFQYLVINDPQIDGVSVGDVLQSDGAHPYIDTTNSDVYIAADLVETSPELFQSI